jgi:hypothetical protein
MNGQLYRLADKKTRAGGRCGMGHSPNFGVHFRRDGF